MVLGTDIQKYEPGQLSFHSLVAGRNIYLPPPKPPAHCSPTNTNLSLLAAGRGQTWPGPDLPFYFWHVWLISWGFYRLAPKLKIDIRPEFCPITKSRRRPRRCSGRWGRARKWFRENQASSGLTPPVRCVTSPRIAPGNMKLGSLMRLERQRRNGSRTRHKNLLSIDSTVYCECAWYWVTGPAPPAWDQIFPAEELWRLLLVTPGSRTC